MRLVSDKVILRDMIESDIEERIRWQTVETEWLLWDAPWENDPKSIHYVPFDEETYRRGAEKKLETLRNSAQHAPRQSFEICINDARETHIGWCNCYFIDDMYFYCPTGTRRAIGIDIPCEGARNRGYATAAWKLFIAYLVENGAGEIYTQTWSGNLRVQGLIHKLGFLEVDRKEGLRLVRGERYDALTFRLGQEALTRLVAGTSS